MLVNLSCYKKKEEKKTIAECFRQQTILLGFLNNVTSTYFVPYSIVSIHIQAARQNNKWQSLLTDTHKVCEYFSLLSNSISIELRNVLLHFPFNIAISVTHWVPYSASLGQSQQKLPESREETFYFNHGGCNYVVLYMILFSIISESHQWSQ